MPISAKQMSLVHVAVARLHLDDATYRSILREVAGVDSSRDLDRESFERVMDRFARLGFKSEFRERTFGHRAGMATPAQVEKLRGLWSDYTAGEGTDVTLGKWLDRHFKVSALRFLTTGQAHKAIGALSKMIDRRSLEGVSNAAT